MSKGARAGLLVAAAAVAALAFVLLRPSGEKPPSTAATETTAASAATEATTTKPEPQVATIRVKGGQPVGGVRKLTFREGERIRFRVTDDAGDEVHLHGYDVEKPVGPGEAANFSVPATITGRFEVELHNSATPIAEVSVEP